MYMHTQKLKEMIQCGTPAYTGVVDEDKERCKRDDLGQTVARQSDFDADLQQTTYTTAKTTHTVSINSYYRVGQKNRTVFRLDNFVTVSPRKACRMSKFSKFY